MFMFLDNDFASNPVGNSANNSVAPTNAPQESPLDQLKDIHLPENIDQFPSAIGWWILLALVVLTILFFIVRAIKKHKALRYLRMARIELVELSKQEANNSSISELSALLKRVCLIYFPTKQVASLNGHQWWYFLNEAVSKTSKKIIYSENDIMQLTQVRYQKDSTMSESDWKQLIEKTEDCLEALIRLGIKNKGKMLAANMLSKNGVTQ